MLDGRWFGWVSSFFVRYKGRLFTLDWTLAIDRNRDALLRMLAALLVMAGGGAVSVMPRFARVEAWRVLRPVEAALRRLVVVVQFVQGIKARYVPRLGRAGAVNVPRGSGRRAAVFALFDRRKCFDLKGLKRVTRGNPRLWMPGMDAPVFVTKTVPMADDMVNAARLCRRLQAVQAALEDLPKQARRLARMQAKRAVAGAGVYIRPMRPGRPPGHRARKRHPVDEVLSNCHELALYVLYKPPDTS